MAKLNEKAELFQRYITKKDPQAFQVIPLPDNPLHTVIFRSQLNVDGTPLPLIVEMDDSPFGILRVPLEPKAVKEGKKEALHELMNQLNAHYKIYKFYLDNQDNLLLDTSVIFRDANVDGNMLYSLFNVMIHDLKDIQKDVKKTLYGEEAAADKPADAPEKK